MKKDIPPTIKAQTDTLVPGAESDAPMQAAPANNAVKKKKLVGKKAEAENKNPDIVAVDDPEAAADAILVADAGSVTAQEIPAETMAGSPKPVPGVEAGTSSGLFGGAGSFGGLLSLGAISSGGIVVALASGKSGGGSSSPGGGASTTTLSVHDGAISGAAVVADGNNNGIIDFIDANNNGRYDPGETLLFGDTYLGLTGSDGRLTNVQPSAVAGKTLLTSGGIDITTGLPVTVSYKAVAGSTVINPLTSLVQKLVEGGMSAGDANTAVKTALGIAPGIDLSSYDLTVANADLGIQKAAIQVANILTVAEGMDAGLSDKVLGALADSLKNGSIGSVADLADTNLLEAVLTAAQGDSVADNTPDIAKALASANTVVNGSATLGAAIEAQKVAQGSLVETIQDGGDLSDYDHADKINIRIYDKTAPILNLDPLSDNVLSDSAEKSGFQQSYTALDENLKAVTAVIKDSAGKVTMTLSTENGFVSGDLSSLADGVYTIVVTAVDMAGNKTVREQKLLLGEGSAISIAPVSDGAINAVEATGPAFISGITLNVADGEIVTVTLGGKTYSAAVLDNAWSVEIPAADIQTLPQGTVMVTADVAGAPQASQHFNYDPTPPSLVLGNYAINADMDSPASFAYAFSASDTGSGLSTVNAKLKTTGGSELGGVSLTVGDGMVTGNLSSLARGTYVIELTAVDAAGNSTTTSQSFLYDDTTSGTPLVMQKLTDTILTQSEAAQYTQTYSWKDHKDVITTAVLQDAAGNTVTGVPLLVNASAKIISGDLSGLADGVYRVVIKIDYKNGKEVIFKEQLLTIDTSAPTLALEVLTNSTLSDADVAGFQMGYAASDSNGHGVEVIVHLKDGNGVLLKSIPLASAQGVVKDVLSGLASGDYTLEFVATDKAGNSVTQTQALTIATTAADTTSPTVVISDDTDGTATGAVTYAFEFSEPVTGFSADAITVTGGTKGAFTQITASSYTLTVTPDFGKTGNITVEVAPGAAQDLAGNDSLPATAEAQSFDTTGISLTNATADSGISFTGKARFAEFADFDGDGKIDLFIGGHEGPSALYKGNGDGTFTDVTASTIGTINMKMGNAVWLDYDNDGDMDLLLLGDSTATRLLQNNDGVFTDVAAAAGINLNAKAKSVAVGDFNGDGHLDFYVAVEEGLNRLYVNNGDGTFTESAAALGIAGASGGKSVAAQFVDYNGDGHLDLFVGNKEQPSLLYRNNGDGTFTNVTDTTIGNVTMKLSGPYSGIAWGDFNNDGRLDLFLPGEETASRLLMQNADGTFTNVAVEAGVAGSSSAKSKVAQFVDLNGDGNLDLVVIGDGVTHIYQNNGDGTFTNVTGTAGVGITTKGRDIALADIDGNGMVDMIITSEEGTRISVYTNNFSSSRPLVSITDDKSGVTNDDITFTFTFNKAVPGFSADDITVTGGTIGTFTAVSESVYTLVVTPAADTKGVVQVSVAENVVQDTEGNGNFAASASQAIDTEKPTVTVTDDTTGTATGPVTYTFTFSEAVTGFTADDITVTNGTAGTFTKVSDLVYTLLVTPMDNATGNITISVAAGALTDIAGNPNAAFSDSAQAFDTLTPDTTPPMVIITDDTAGTATGPVTYTFTFDEPVTGFTADGITVTGGTKGEFNEVTPRVYTLKVTPDSGVTGNITVEVAAGAAKDLSGNDSLAATAEAQPFDTTGISLTNATADSGISFTGKARFAEFADFDGDGKVDLFIGGHEGPSALYKGNGDGTFTDVTASTIGTINMKMGNAVWLDYDNDGDMDLLLLGDSTATRLLQNNGGVFTDVAAAAGITLNAKAKSVAVGDFNGDGHLDFYVAVEEGLNRLYVNNGDGTFTESAAALGIAGASGGKSVAAQFVDYDGDGHLDLFVGNKEQPSLLYRNDGNGGFIDVTATTIGTVNMKLSGPYSGIAWGDFNNDGRLDLFLPGEETASRLLMQNADGTFTNVAVEAGVAGSSSAKSKVAQFVDLNGDGNLDLVVIGDGVTHIYQNNGDGTFTNVTDAAGVDITTKGRDIALADIDGNGMVDMIIASEDGTRISIYENNLNPAASGLTVTGTATSETLIGSAGDDVITGNGGADVMYGGAGNDTFVLNADNIAQLSAGVTDGKLARIDGGDGIDTIKLDGSGLTLDLTAIANSRVTSIERIDLTGSGDNTLKLSLSDVLDMSGSNLFNSGSGWSGLGDSVARHQVVVTGDIGDKVEIGVNWTTAGSATYEGSTYAVYNQGNAQLLIDNQITVI